MNIYVKTYKIYISEAQSLIFEKAFKRKVYTLETLKKKINKKHSVLISLNIHKKSIGYITISIINNLDNSLITSCCKRISTFNDINKFIYKLVVTQTEEYLVKLFIEQKNDYEKRKYTLNYNYVHTYTENDYWELLKILNPINTQELLDYSFVLLLNADVVYSIKNYREILKNKLHFYGLDTDNSINPIEKIDYEEDIYILFYKMLLYEVIDDINNLGNISNQMRLRRQEKIRDKVFEMYDKFIKNKDVYEQPIIYL